MFSTWSGVQVAVGQDESPQAFVQTAHDQKALELSSGQHPGL
jgi:hypothetical protein